MGGKKWGLVGLKFKCLPLCKNKRKMYLLLSIAIYCSLIFFSFLFEFIFQFRDVSPEVEVLSHQRKLQYVNHPGRFDCFRYIPFIVASEHTVLVLKLLLHF